MRLADAVTITSVFTPRSFRAIVAPRRRAIPA